MSLQEVVCFESAGIGRDEVAHGDFDGREVDADALFVGRVADAMAEGGACGRVDGGRDIAGQGPGIVFLRWIRFGDGGDEGLGVGVFRVFVDFFSGSCFDDFAEVHDGNAVRDVFDDGEIVRDEEVGEFSFFLQVEEEVEDLRLDRDVERGDGFVEDEEFRVECEGAGDADALALAAGEFEGEAVDGVRREADAVEEGADTVAAFCRGADAVDEVGFGDDLADGHALVEGVGGVLEDHLDAGSEGAEAVFGEV